MRVLKALSVSVAFAALCVPTVGHADALDVTEAPSCAETAAQVQKDPESYDVIRAVLMWSHGYVVGSEGLPAAFNYKAIESALKNLSDGKCADGKANMFAVAGSLARKQVPDDDSYDLTLLTCEELFKDYKDDSGRFDRATAVADLAWLPGYAAASRKAPPKLDLAVVGTAIRLTLDKCKSSPKLNVSTLLELTMPEAAASLAQAAPKATPAPAPEPAPAAVAPAPTPVAPAPEPAPALAPAVPAPAAAPAPAVPTPAVTPAPAAAAPEPAPASAPAPAVPAPAAKP